VEEPYLIAALVAISLNAILPAEAEEEAVEDPTSPEGMSSAACSVCCTEQAMVAGQRQWNNPSYKAKTVEEQLAV